MYAYFSLVIFGGFQIWAGMAAVAAQIIGSQIGGDAENEGAGIFHAIFAAVTGIANEGFLKNILRRIRTADALR